MLRAVIVDDEPAALNYFKTLCQKASALKIEETFTNPILAMDYLLNNSVDVVFLDIEMPELNGLMIAKKLQELRRNIFVVFMTGYEQYALDAYRADAIAYLLKPGTLEELNQLLDRLHQMKPQKQQRVYIQTMDTFDVFVDGQPINFIHKKAKEMLAVLVDNGGSIVTMDKMISILWEDRCYDEKVKQLYRKAVNYLNKLCAEQGLDFFESYRGSSCVKKEKTACDLYALFEGDKEAIGRYHGKYMFEYPWSEYTMLKIEKYLENNNHHWNLWDE